MILKDGSRMKSCNLIRLFVTALIVVVAAVAPSATVGKSVDSSGKAKFTLCLDPGHGGKDVGCVGKKTNEKTIVLRVANKLQALIEKNLDDYVDVVMTRDGDYFVTLQGRAEKANHSHSDLFVSIHVNSVAKSNKRRTTISGCQVYTLGLHKTAENLEVARQENAAMEFEADQERYADFDPNSLEGDILFELTQSARMDRSIDFADNVHTRLSTGADRKQLGVRQAGFWVLWATSMPSVLIELDFISNPDSEEFLASDKGCDRMAKAIYDAFCDYLENYGPALLGREIRTEKS